MRGQNVIKKSSMTTTRRDKNARSLPLSVKEVFEIYDTDGSGTISFEEFQSMLPDLGIRHLTVPRQLEYFRLCDEDGSGQIDLSEMKVALYVCEKEAAPSIGRAASGRTSSSSDCPVVPSPQDAFKMFDKDDSGKIDEDEFHFLMEYLDIKMDERAYEKMFKKYDTDESGFIEYPEFKRAWLRLGDPAKELHHRGIVDLPPRASRLQLIKILEGILDEEEERQASKLREARRWKEEQDRLRFRKGYVDRALHRARFELCSALDAAGQVYVFGNGTMDQFSGRGGAPPACVKDDISNLEGSALIRHLWLVRAPPATTRTDKAATDSVERRGVLTIDAFGNPDPLRHDETLMDEIRDCYPSFDGLNVQDGTFWLWGKSPMGLAISDSTIFTYCKNRSIYAFGGNEHWWHNLQSGSRWQTCTRGEMTSRTSALMYCSSIPDDGALADSEDRHTHNLTLGARHGTWKEIHAGASHVGLTDENGSLYMWGSNSTGRLGIGRVQEKNVIDRPTRIQLPEEAFVSTFSCGYSHTAAVCDSGNLYLWGSASSGKLGLGDCTTYQECYCAVPTRLKIPSCRTVTRVSCGASHSACVSGEYELFVWGCGDGGRLGLGAEHLSERLSPTLVESLKGKHVVDVSCGNFQTLAITAIKSVTSFVNQCKVTENYGGALYVAGPSSTLGSSFHTFGCYAWFEDEHGNTSPEPIEQVSAGFMHQSAVSIQGELFTWGENIKGCCGHKTGRKFISCPSLVACLYTKPKKLAVDKPCRSSVSCGNQPFYEIDLGELCTIKEIKLWNKIDDPTNPAVSKNTFTSRLFPCWIMTFHTQLPESLGEGQLKEAVKCSIAKERFVENKQDTTWLCKCSYILLSGV